MSWSSIAAWWEGEAARMRGSDGFSPTLPAAGVFVVSLLGVGVIRVPTAVALVFWLITIGTWAAVIDARTRRLPDAVVIILAAGFLGAVAAGAAALWDGKVLLGALLGAVVYGGIFFAGAVFGQAGLGDAKLGAILGFGLGGLGFSAWIIGVVAALVAALPHAIVLASKRAKHGVPLGPYMVAGGVLGAVTVMLTA